MSAKLGFIGGGNMAEAIIGGVIRGVILPPEDILVTDISDTRRAFLVERYGVKAIESNRELVRRSEVVLFAVKPQTMGEVLAEIAPESQGEHLFLSICAGTRTSRIEEGLRNPANPMPRVVRVMPNTPALIGLGVAGVSLGLHARLEDLDFPRRIFEAIGTVTTMPESMMDAVTALTGSGPAYVFHLIESLIDAGIAVGFAEEDARKMVIQMVLGSATLASQSDKSPAELRRAVTSPGGTTAAGIAVLESREVKNAYIDCVKAATRRGEELSGG